MLFPIADDDRALTRGSYVTNFLLAANVAVFVYQLLDPAFTYGWSLVPAEVVSGRDLVGSVPLSSGETVLHEPGPWPIQLTLLTSMFMHGGLLHLAGNLLYLWIFGDNVEHRFGHVAFLLFYLAGGLAGSLAQIAVDPASPIPNLGASGAISGVMGAYLILFPRNRVYAVFFFTVVSVPAFLTIGLWVFLQIVNGYGAIAMPEQSGGIAYGAHIGGFVAGVVLALAHRLMWREERESPMRRHYQSDERSRLLW